MSKLIADELTLLVVDGEPYELVKEEEVQTNDVCQLCDLQDRCMEDVGSVRLIALCVPLTGEQCYFFRRNWEIVNKQIIDYINYKPEDMG